MIIGGPVIGYRLARCNHQGFLGFRATHQLDAATAVLADNLLEGVDAGGVDAGDGAHLQNHKLQPLLGQVRRLHVRHRELVVAVQGDATVHRLYITQEGFRV